MYYSHRDTLEMNSLNLCRKIYTFLGEFFPTCILQGFLKGVSWQMPISTSLCWYLLMIFRLMFGKTKAGALPLLSENTSCQNLSFTILILTLGPLYIFTVFHCLPTIYHSAFTILMDLFPCLLTAPSMRAGLRFVLCCPPVYSLRTRHRAGV